ncbi:chloride channel protein [Nitrospinae bacterium AH_259_B05_G02_I21]|nr:chloride channel protein [Nitrospinae bacterium AH_259_B05_G02_I21]
MGGAIVGPIIYFLAREAKGTGVPVVMEAVVIRGGAIRPRVVMVKALVSALTIGSGGSVGREGPIVHIGSALGSALGQMLKVSGERLRTFVGCGAAAGIAATFNAPIAGALFSVEVILGDFGLARFSPIVISSVVATVISRYFLGDFPAFRVPLYRFVHAFELLPYLLLGVAAGLVGRLFIFLLYRCEDLFEASPLPEAVRPALGGLLIGTIALAFPHIYGVGYETINLSLREQVPYLLLLSLVFFKMLATAIAIGSGQSGGIFAPSLFIGAMTGGAVGAVAHSLFPALTATSGAYALVGMGAVVAATTHAPITAIIILFELTGSYTIILPLMVSCITAILISAAINKESVYTLRLARRGLSIRAGLEETVLKTLRVRDVMSDRFQCLPEDMPLEDLVTTALRSPYSYFPLVDDKGLMTGIISHQDLRMAMMYHYEQKALLVAKDVATTEGILTVFPHDDLATVFEMSALKRIDELPVVEPDNPRKVVGMVNHKDVLAAYNRELLRRSVT